MEGKSGMFGPSADQKTLFESLLGSEDVEDSDLCEYDLLLLQNSAGGFNLDTLREFGSLMQEVDELQVVSECLVSSAPDTMVVPQSPSSLVASLKSAVNQSGKAFAAQVVDAAISLDCPLTLEKESDAQVNPFYSKLMEDYELSQKLVSTLNAGIEDYEYEFIWTILQVKEQAVDREVEEFRTRLALQQAALPKLKPNVSNEWIAQLKQAVEYNK